MTTIGEDPSSVRSLEDDSEEALLRAAQDAPMVRTIVRASISMRGHLAASLNMMRDMAAAAKEGNLKAVQSIAWEAEALIAENNMMGLDISRVPSMPLESEKLTLDFFERIYGVQRVRVAAREANQMKKVGR